MPLAIPRRKGRDWPPALPGRLIHEHAGVDVSASPAALPLDERLAAAAALVRPGPALGAWNPLPLARTCPVVLPASGPPPPAMRSRDGAQHPLQAIAEGWLVQLALPPLAGAALEPLAAPVAGAHWEVSPSVLDNGRVRAELDPLGRIARLCWDGVFADLAGPAVDPGDSTAAVVAVAEAGPVRARVTVQRDLPGGRLELAYVLHALDDHLLIAARWLGAGDCWLDHPTRVLSTGVDACERRWASLADAAGRGLAIAAGSPVEATTSEHGLRVRVGAATAYALAAPRRGRGLTLGQLAEHLAVPAQAGAGPIRPAVRLAEPVSLTPLWAARPEGWDGELLLAEQAGARTRTWLLADRSRGGECWKVDATGAPIARCPASPEGDGWQLDAEAGELLRVRWRLPAATTP